MREERKPREECGVFGVWSPEKRDLASLVYCGLFALQHRGQESAGIAVNDDGLFRAHRDAGLVSEVFTHGQLEKLGRGNIAVGHVRYATTGSDGKLNAQPLLVNHRKGAMALAHNGNLVNAMELRRALEERGSIFHTTTDSEVIAYMIVQERLRSTSIEEAVSAAMDDLEGAYSLVIASPAKLIAARDPHGFRPLCMGRTEAGEIVFASESCALDAVGASFLRDIEPGEVVTVGAEGIKSDRRHCGLCPRRLCVFEYIYFARPDSVVDGAGVCLARQRAGAFLAETCPAEADVVIGVPDSGLDAAIGYAGASGIPYAIGFTKNKYVGRTFIQPTQTDRENLVRTRRAAEAESHPGRGGGQTGRADRRFHRPGHHLPENDPAPARRRGQRDPHAGVRASLCGPLLVRHGYRQRGKPDRQSPQHPGDRRHHRGGQPWLPDSGAGKAPHRAGQRLLHGLLRRRLSHRRPFRRAEGPL